MSTVVVSTSPGFGRVGRVPEVLDQQGWTVHRCIDTAKPWGGAAQFLDSAEFLVIGLIGADAGLIGSAPKLRGILKHGVGTDNIDIAAATARGIPVLNAPGTNANAVAELAVGGMFAAARRIPMVHRTVVDGGWERFVGTEIEGKTLGIVGLGNIGRALARKARALDMRVLAADPYPDLDFCRGHDIEVMALERMLGQVDYLSLHLFGGAGNAGLIGAAQLAKMKPTACVMNFARGEIVDFDALAAVLADGRLGAAVIDAYDQEPPDRSHPIFALPNVVFTPHSGADTTEAVEKMGLTNIADIRALLAGERPARILNPGIFD